MKYLFCLGVSIFLSSAVHSQDLSSSDFYRSFHSKLAFHNYSSYKDKVSLHSIRLKAGNDGMINEWEVSASVDSMLRRDIARAFNLMDKNHLRIANYKNTTMILPLIYLSGPSMPVDHRMWNYGSESDNTNSSPKLLPPLVIFMNFSRMIDN